MNSNSNKQIIVLGSILVVGVIAAIAILLNSQNTQQNQGSNNNNTSVATNTTPVNTDEAERTYTLAELATHSSASDCYVAYKGVVYNISSYVSNHPGGFGIVAACGTEIDPISESHAGGSFDSASVQAVFANSRIGRLQN